MDYQAALTRWICLRSMVDPKEK